MNYAPILISVYDRVNHLKQCVDSLKKNKEAENSELYIAVDYPAKKEHAAGINEVVKFCEQISGFKKVNIIKRTENLGAGNNMRKARLELFEKYDRVITMEDDNVVSPNFLEYMNGALDFYENDERIVTVSGFNFPIRIPPGYDKDVYVWPAVNGYGVGWWRKKFSLSYFEINDFEEFIFDDDAIDGFMNVAEHILPIMLDGISRGVLQGDAVKSYNYFRRGKFNLYPTVSKVRNLGYDGSGVNCNVDERYLWQQIDDGKRKTEFVENIMPDASVYESLREYFRIGEQTKENLRKTILLFREVIDEKRKTRKEVRSPLTNGRNVTLEREIPTEFIEKQYAVYGVDTKRFFGDAKKISLYKCNETGFRFYFPFTLAGDGEFYEQLQKIPWYYMEEKWEFGVALDLLKGGEKVLEIGSGKGGFLRKARAKNIDVYGAELNKLQAENLRAEGFSVFDENIENSVDAYSESFDAVCAFQVLEHVSNPKSFIETSLKLLKRGGKLIYSVPNHDSFMGLDDENFLDMPPHHMGLWDENSLVALERFFPVKVSKIFIEPLQAYHLDYYKAVFEKKYDDKYSIKGEIFKRAEKEPNKIKGFTILVEYVKK